MTSSQTPSAGRPLDDSSGAYKPQSRTRPRSLLITDQADVFFSVFQTCLDGMAFFDARFIIRTCNESFANYARLPVTSIVGYHGSEVIPGWKERVAPIFRASQRNRKPCHVHAYHLIPRGRPDSDECFWDATVTPFYSPRGSFLGYLLLVRDVTEHKKLEKALQETNRLLAAEKAETQERADKAARQASQMTALLESMSEGVVVLDTAGRFVFMNEAAGQMLGLSREQLEGATSFSSLGVTLLRLDGTPLPPAEWAGATTLREGKACQEFILVRPDGTRRQLVASGSAVRNEQGEAEMAIIVYRDVTELRELEQTKENYLLLISHDLRNPLTVIQGYAQGLLRKASLVGRERLMAEFILSSAHRMNWMIQDLVDSARLEAGTIHLKRQPVQFRKLIFELVEREASVTGWQRVRLDVPDEVVVYSDPNSLERILVNLLSNALKFSPPDSAVTLKAAKADDKLLASVEDHGAGISPEHLPYIFNRFYRVRGGRKATGMGLGLHICKLLLGAQDGRIWVRSESGRGSTFYFTLPLA